ncbi:MAG: hypothetical protein IJC07_01540 [Clostridia bacterium]|nr:hypothetical protein [Clostridia bacterium]
MKSKIIAISAIAAAFVALILTLGAYIEFIDLFTIVMSSAFVILPFYYKSYKGCILAYLVGGIIGFLFSGFNIFSIVFPSYFLFFGVYPIVRQKFEDKKVKKYITIPVGLIWFTATVYGIDFYYIGVMGQTFSDLPDFILKNMLWILAIISVVLYFIYDKYIYVVRKVTDRYLAKMKK